jgi:hypothetical protein
MRSLRPNNSGRRSQHIGSTAKEPERDGQDRISELDDAVAETAMKTFAAEAHGTDGKAPTRRRCPGGLDWSFDAPEGKLETWSPKGHSLPRREPVVHHPADTLHSVSVTAPHSSVENPSRGQARCP